MCSTRKNQLIDVEFDDDEKFGEIVFEFIERIGKEAIFYDNYEPNINANDFKHIEMQIQAQRIEKVLNLCIYKIERIFNLSELIEYYIDHLKLFFSREDAEKIEKFAGKWSDVTVDPTNSAFNSDMNECIQMLENMDINKQQISPSGRSIVHLLTELCQIARYRIQMSAATEMAKQKVLHQLWSENTKNIGRTQQIRRAIEEDQLKVSGNVTVKQDELEHYEMQRRQLTHKNSMTLNRLIIESNKAMTEICDIGKCHQSAATESVMRAKEMFDTLRKNDICEENEATHKKIDLEWQLKNFLQIYDEEIGARSLRLRECKNILRRESNMLDEWKEKYKVQEILYNKIQLDIEAEEEMRREERILLFMMNRVARIIQRHYRRVLAQRKSKKKGKGKKGGKGKK